MIKTIESPEYTGTYKAKFTYDRVCFQPHRVVVWERIKLFGVIYIWKRFNSIGISPIEWMQEYSLREAIDFEHDYNVTTTYRRSYLSKEKSKLARNWLYELLFPR